MRIISKLMKDFGEGFMKIAKHRNYFLGWAILLGLQLTYWLFVGNAPKYLLVLLAVTIMMDLLCWVLDVNNNGKGKYYTFTFSTKKGGKNV